MNTPPDPLQHIPLLKGLSGPTQAQLRRHLMLRAYPPGRVIQLEADPAEGAHFILTGRVQVFRTSAEGREQVLANLGPGEALNMVPLFREEAVNPASARALTPVQSCFVLREPFLQMVERSPDLALALLRDFAGKLTALTGLVKQLSLHSIRGRLARFLIEQADNPRMAGRWTQDEMAAHLGTVRDVVGRILRSFEDAGYVRRQQGRMELLDRAALEAEAEL